MYGNTDITKCFPRGLSSSPDDCKRC